MPDRELVQTRTEMRECAVMGGRGPWTGLAVFACFLSLEDGLMYCRYEAGLRGRTLFGPPSSQLTAAEEARLHSDGPYGGHPMTTFNQ